MPERRLTTANVGTPGLVPGVFMKSTDDRPPVRISGQRSSEKEITT